MLKKVCLSKDFVLDFQHKTGLSSEIWIDLRLQNSRHSLRSEAIISLIL